MTSVNDVLMKFFKLPPAVKMMLALAGFGSLASILFFVLPALRTKNGRLVVLIIGAIGLAVLGLVLLVRWLIAGRKSKELSGALGAHGPSRGDIAEQERIYREKFLGKLNDLRSNGLSVYKLPWFVLMGEPGSGKTASLIHSGLDFPLGKDEVPGFGGTRNYNWWFTNEAVILDTAGRIAFHEEGTTDKTEWEYFLKLLKRYRPRCPINGVVIALPADRLLRDTAEERAQKASVLRERLRQVHQILGVRFPTFILVTKMDLVGGFNEFFEEVRVDLLQRNQMFGWSRPGEFQEPFDPGTFPGVFDGLYRRVRDWAMRYLQRKSTEQELGMIVTFPEAFRQLGPALHEFVSTLFQRSPLVEPPFFRGVYFTSAVQEGAPIFDIFSRTRTGLIHAERATKAVDSKAFFIHDFYAKKVFPEQGLVFRSARHATLNRRMRRLVWAGTGGMAALMLAFFGIGASGVNSLVTQPRESCKSASEKVKARADDLSKLEANVELARKLHGYVDSYDRPWTWLYARMLFIGANIRQPQRDVATLHNRFVLESILRPVLSEMPARFAGASLKSEEERRRFVAAAQAYATWYAEAVGGEPAEELKTSDAAQRRKEFEALLALTDVPEAVRNGAAAEFEYALSRLSSQTRAFAQHVLRGGAGWAAGTAPAETAALVTAINRIRDEWKPLTLLSDKNANKHVKFWAEFAGHVRGIQERYSVLLALGEQFRDASKRDAARAEMLKLAKDAEYIGDPYNPEKSPEPPAGSLYESFYRFARFLYDHRGDVPETPEKKILRLSALLDLFIRQWNGDFDPIEAALKRGAPKREAQPQKEVYAALDGARAELSDSFSSQLKELRIKLGIPDTKDALDLLDQLEQWEVVDVVEAQPPQPFSDTVSITLSKNLLGPDDIARKYLLEVRGMVETDQADPNALDDLTKWPALLESSVQGDPSGPNLNAWFVAVRKEPTEDKKPVVLTRSKLAERPLWRAQELYGLADGAWAWRKTLSTADVLAKMQQRLAKTLAGEQSADDFATLKGVAQLMPGYREPAKNLPFDRHRFNSREPIAAAQPPPKPEPKPEPARPAEEDDDGGLGRLGGRAAPPAGQQTQPPAAAGVAPAADETLRGEPGREMLYRYHTRGMLVATLRQVEVVDARFREFGDASKTAREALARAADAYVDGYMGDWFMVYSDPTRLLSEGLLDLLRQCREGSIGWPEFVAAVTGEKRDIAAALAERSEALIREGVLFDADLKASEGGNTPDDAVLARLSARLGALKQQQRSVFDTMRAVRAPRNRPDPQEGSVEAVFAAQLQKAWNGYVSAAKTLGPLTEESAGAAAPPSAAAMEKELSYKNVNLTEYQPGKPLLELARYGEQLLAHHLDSRIATLMQPYNGRYPVVDRGAISDASAGLTQLSGLATIAPDDLVALLKQTETYRARFGELYRKVNPDSPGLRTLDAAGQWVKFLYADPSGLARGDKPPPIKLWLAIVKDPDLANAGNVYVRVSMSLALLTANNTPAGTIEMQTRTGEGIPIKPVQDAIAALGPTPNYALDLFGAAKHPFGEMTVRVYERAPDANPATYPAEAFAWRLRPDPWLLLAMFHGLPANDLQGGYYRVPVRFEFGAQKVPTGFAIGVRMERPIPAPIPPYTGPGPRPPMIAAEQFLAGRGG